MADRHPVYAKEKFLTRDDVRRVAAAEATTTTNLADGTYGEIIVSGGGTVMSVEATLDGGNF